MKDFIKKKLFDSLYAHDLVDMVEEKITIAEYAPKIDKTAIVMTLFSQNEDAAYDLSRFIEFGPFDVLDTEVSPAPDEDGNYLIFVEMENEGHAQRIMDILRVVKHLTTNDEYKWTAYGKDGDFPLKI